MGNRIGKEIKTTNNLITRYIHKYLKSKGQDNLTPIQIDIIDYLDSNNVVYQKDLEKEFNLRRSTISGILQTMENNGILNKYQAKNDLRSKQIKLTQKGRKMCDALMLATTEINRELEKNIKSKDLKQFFKVIEQINKNMEEDIKN